MKNIESYVPRHAGETARALSRSAQRRASVDLDRATKLLDDQVARGNMTAIVLQLRVGLPAQLRLLVAS